MSESLNQKYVKDDAPAFVAEYRGDFKGQIEKIDYAYGSTITSTLAVVSVPSKYINRLRKDVPSIIFIEQRSIYLLQDILPSNVDNIKEIKINPYLGFTGRGVLVGMVDSGIDYLNEEFIREDGTSRIVSIWDQTIVNEGGDGEPYLGKIYDNSKINEAINVYKNGGNPYEIVPVKDEEGHGTKMAGIIGARGYNESIEGIATDCEFVIVKLLPSPNYKKILKDNGVNYVPVYNNSEVLAAIEYLRKVKESLKKPMVVYLGVGSQDGSHDGNNLTGRYVAYLGNRRGLVFVSGTGNSAADEGHASSFIKNVGETHTIELLISQNMKILDFDIWIQRPNKMSLRITSPAGEVSDFIQSRVELMEERNFFLTDTKVSITGFDPENYTGHQLFSLKFERIKSGIWKLELKGEYIVNGRYDIWLPDKLTLPEGVKFLKPNPYNTLTIPSTAKKVVTVSYYNSETNSIVSSSGKGFNTNGLINPDITTAGVGILAISNNNKVEKVSGSSAATAIVAGVCAILLQWGIVNENDSTMNSTKIRSLLVYAAIRENLYEYPNEDLGYGKLDALEVFKILGGNYRIQSDCIEYYINNLYIRIPKDMCSADKRRVLYEE